MSATTGQRHPRQALDMVCSVCGAGFIAARKNALYCSGRCQKRGSTRARFARKQCVICGGMFSPAKATSTTCSGTCRNTLNARSSIQERADKRRRTGKPTTYIKVDGRHEHRQVMERVLGRALTTDEIVHHKNGDMTDNRPENLEVVTRAEHIEIHRPEMQAARKALLGF